MDTAVCFLSNLVAVFQYFMQCDRTRRKIEIKNIPECDDGEI